MFRFRLGVGLGLSGVGWLFSFTSFNSSTSFVSFSHSSIVISSNSKQPTTSATVTLAQILIHAFSGLALIAIALFLFFKHVVTRRGSASG